MALYTDYTPPGPWKDGQQIKRNVDSVVFTYVANINALIIVNNVAGASKDGGGNKIVDIANPVNPQDAATKSYVDAHAGSGGGPPASTALPLMSGTAAPGVATPYSREDHIHPTDTTRAPLASPAFTGTPTAPTAAANDNSTKIATTAYVAGIGVTGLATVPPLINGTAAVGTSTLAARQDHVHPTDTSRAPLASPTFTGTPAAPTPTAPDNTTKIATTAFVTTVVGGIGVTGLATVPPLMDGVAAVGTTTLAARQDHVHPSDTSRLALAGGTMTGLLVLSGDPAAAVGAATKQYVDNSISGLNGVYTKWVPYTGTGQSFLAQQMTRDGDWTMVANKATTTRPAPQASGAEEDLLPNWIPTAPNARATYTVYNEWTLSQGGWLNTYGADVNAQNLGLGFTHAVSLSINGTVVDTFTAIPQNAGTYLHDITPIVVASGAVIRVTMTVTETSNNQVYWFQQAGLFATPPNYCSSAVGSKDGAAAGTTAYGLHATFIPGTASPDWYVVAFGGSAVPGEGAGGLADAPSDGNLYGRLNAAWSVVAVASGTVPLMDGIAAVGTGAAWARGDHIHPSDTSRAPLASPALTGTPSAPTPAPTDNSTTLATTAYVTAAITAVGGIGEAPNDGTSYMRNSLAWSNEIDAGTF
jgi:hypothetical protein